MTKLYIISPPIFDLDEFEEQLKLAFSGGEVSVFQLRMKSLAKDGTYTAPENPSKIVDAIKRLKPICHQNNCVFILNDNPKLAKEYDCDGVHLGDEDVSVAEAREILGKNKIIGASCYASKDLAFEACKQSANYVAFGAFYETKTKKPKGRPTLDLLEFWQEYTNIPCVAIGGIKTDNAEPIIKAGADFIAIVTGIWDHKTSPAKAVEEFQSKMI